MMSVKKAVIPAAGFGTRMLPAAKAVPKELLPVLDRPTIQYVVEEAAAAGAEDVLLVTSRGKRSIEDHFDRSPELEQRLAAGGKDDLLASVNALAAKVKVHSVRQPSQRGLGDAVNQARRHVGNEPFLCLLGDAVFSTPAKGAPLPSQQLVEAYREFGTSVIGVEEVPAEKVSRYGVVGGTFVRDGVLRLDTLVEKPSPESAPSRLAIAARYVLTPAIFDCLDQTAPGKGGEVQLTDALRLLLNREPIHAVVVRATRHDIGNPVDWLRTNLVFAARDPATWAALRPLVEQLLRG
jgi:UTP--glucose-1-phosphate uridylyltransferase